jgi:acetyl esterase/lipase
MTRRVLIGGVLAVVGVVTLLAWRPWQDADRATTRWHLVTEQYAAGLDADVFVRGGTTDGPVIVMVHGGAWVGGDRYGMWPLADALAARGAMVVVVELRLDAERLDPTLIDDVVTAAQWSAGEADRLGMRATATLLVGHSSGAHIASVAALDSEQVDGFIGLSGLYDVRRFVSLVEPFFGAPAYEDPDRWHHGNPVARAAERPELPALLVHGQDDELVSPTHSRLLADAWVAHGHDVELRTIPGDHAVTYAPTLADTIFGWAASHRL